MTLLAVLAFLGGLAVLLLALAWAITTSGGARSGLVAFSRAVSEGGIAVRRNVAYDGGPRHRLDIYDPEASAPDGPIVLFLYGGSWRSGEKAMYGFVGSALAAHGFTTVIPDYRLYPEVQFPGFLDDAARAYAWVARELSHAGRRPIVVMGHSAGAHMAALMVLDRRYLDKAGEGLPRPAALVGLAGPYAFDPTTWPSTKDVFASVETADTARPVTFAGPHAPPALLMHGLADDTVKLYNTRDLSAALRSSAVEVKEIELSGIGHFGIVSAMAWGLRWRAPVLEEVVKFVSATKR
ncbi:MAG: alpha/beta hydrolase [Hyphomicrobium sp.]